MYKIIYSHYRFFFTAVFFQLRFFFTKIACKEIKNHLLHYKCIGFFSIGFFSLFGFFSPFHVTYLYRSEYKYHRFFFNSNILYTLCVYMYIHYIYKNIFIYISYDIYVHIYVHIKIVPLCLYKSRLLTNFGSFPDCFIMLQSALRVPH